MKVVATNIAQPKNLVWKGKIQRTGIFKEPTSSPIFLEKENVRDDEVSNRKIHGGIYKACYLFSKEEYPYWKNLYPNSTWNYGMLGENLTVKGLDETQIMVGDIYKIGNAIIQITQPREPCATFGAKMGNQGVLKQFIERARPGTYTSVIKEGEVTVGDTLELISRVNPSISIVQFFELLFAKDKNQEHLKLLVDNEVIPLSKREKLKKHLI
jgi:MOSC domain-containing protein YiiM